MLSLMLSLSLLATAVDPAADQAAERTEAKPEKVKKICREDTTTRSRLKTRICKTQAEWDAADNSAGDNVRTKISGGNGT